jgi:hypothetical protein
MAAGVRQHSILGSGPRGTHDSISSLTTLVESGESLTWLPPLEVPDKGRGRALRTIER